MDGESIIVRVGNRSVPASYIPLQLASIRDSPKFKQLVLESVKANPQEPLIIAVNGFAPYLEGLFATCINNPDPGFGLANREVQYAESVQLPQSADRRAGQIPWTFILDQMNLPEVYKWSFGYDAPHEHHTNDIDNYRFRIGAWVCDQGAYRFDSKIPVVVIFTRPNETAENVIQTHVFPHIFKAAELYDDREADDAVCWVFYQLYNLLSDWQNIISEVGKKLNAAEVDSRRRDLPIKNRTRRLHREVDHIYALDEHLRFHMRCFRKLSKFKIVEATENKHGDSIWEIMDDALDDLGQYDNYLESMKERFTNLIELEFNIENATQSANARFISILGALFIPVSFAASIFGISTIEWPPIWYLYVALPVFLFSLLLVVTLPSYISDNQNSAFPSHRKRIALHPHDFTLIGNEIPDSQDMPVSDGSSAISPASEFRKPPAFAAPDHYREGSRRNPMQTFFGEQQAYGVVGSRKKNLHDDDVRKERMQFKDFEREVDRAGGRRGRKRREDLSGFEGDLWPRARKIRVATDGTEEDQYQLERQEGRGISVTGSRRFQEVDVEKLGSMRLRARSEGGR
ncbi:Hypothetical protein D9617_19g102790 [Elsinoe fawcettii]|nr:Hypothetical protein D9617_19g102790 [Elsinoe fawcettii]